MKEKEFVLGFLEQLVAQKGVEVGKKGIQAAIVTYHKMQSILATSTSMADINTTLIGAEFKPSLENPFP